MLIKLDIKGNKIIQSNLHQLPAPLHNGHLSTTSYGNFTADVKSINWLLVNPLNYGHISTTATATKTSPSAKWPLDKGYFFQPTNEIVENGREIWSVWHVEDWSRQSYFDCVPFILLLYAQIVYDTYDECWKSSAFCFWFKTVFNFFFMFSLPMYDWISIMGYRKQEMSRKNVLYSLKKTIAILHP